MASLVDKLGLGYFTKYINRLFNLKANSESPSFTGIPETTTPEETALENQIVNVGYVNNHGGKLKYIEVENVDMNEYVEYGRYNVKNGSNLPTQNDEYYIDVDVDKNNIIRQFAITVSKNSSKPTNPLEPTNGTLIILGDISVDLVVNGNVDISGTISSNVIASGTITYGSLTGTIKENATLYSCDIEVDGSASTINSDLVSDNEKLYTTGYLYVNSGSYISIYSDITINYSSSSPSYAMYNEDGEIFIYGLLQIYTSRSYGFRNYSGTIIVMKGGNLIVEAVDNGSTQYPIHNRGTVIVKSGGSITASAANSSLSTTYGFSNANANVALTDVESGGIITATGTFGVYNSGTINCDGEIYGYGTSTGYNQSSSSAVITGSGIVYDNDTVYYDGSNT